MTEEAERLQKAYRKGKSDFRAGKRNDTDNPFDWHTQTEEWSEWNRGQNEMFDREEKQA